MSATLGRAFVSIADRLSLSLLERYVLWLLCDYMNDRTGQCNPSIPTLAAKSNATGRGVIDAVAKLEKEGFISVTRSPGRGNKYQILPPESWPVDGEPVNPVHPCTQFTREDSSLHPCTQFTTPVNSLHHTRELSSPEPLKEPLNEPGIELLKEGEGQKTTFKDLCLTELPSSWLDWIVEAHPDFLPERAFEMFNNFWLEKRSKKTPQEWFERFKLSTDGIPASRIDWVCGRPTKKQTTRKSGHKAYRQPDHVATFEEMGLI